MPEGELEKSLPVEVIDATFRLGQLALEFGRVNRALYHEDGVTPESDTDHTIMLSWVACAYADCYAPHMDVGLIAQFALLHDMVEVYAGDTPTFLIPDDERVAKVEREAEAFQRIKSEFENVYPWFSQTIAAYESLTTPEARYVKIMDKLMPKIVQVITEFSVYKRLGKSKEELVKEYERQKEVYTSSYAFDQTEAFSLWDGIVGAILSSY